MFSEAAATAHSFSMPFGPHSSSMPFGQIRLRDCRLWACATIYSNARLDGPLGDNAVCNSLSDVVLEMQAETNTTSLHGAAILDQHLSNC
mgnify:CR=1 FL=1